jgi:lipopolysaccharide export system permease protein
MRLSRKLARSVAGEVGSNTLLGLVAVGAVLLGQNLLRQLEDLGAQLSARELLDVLAALVATFAGYALPIAFLFGVLSAVGRMSSDSEVVAMRSLGLGLSQLLAPVLGLALPLCLLTGWLLGWAQPAARREMRAIGARVASRGGFIEAGQFSSLDRSGRQVIFVERNDAGTLRGIVFHDSTDAERPYIAVAPRGRFVFEAATAEAHLLLEEGDVVFDAADPSEQRTQRIAFDRLDYTLDLSRRIGAGFSRLLPGDMSNRDLLAVIARFDETGEAPSAARVKEREHYALQLQRRIALPFTPLLFGLVGVALGVRRVRGARSWGWLLGVALAFGYYVLLSLGSFLVERGITPAGAIWLPNASFFAAALPLLRRAARFRG